jgi:putative transposase
MTIDEIHVGSVVSGPLLPGPKRGHCSITRLGRLDNLGIRCLPCSCTRVPYATDRSRKVFHKPGDSHAFLEMRAEATVRIPMRILADCLMSNHFHLALWPYHDGDLSRWMHWLLTTHVRRYLRHYGSSGHVWQGRFKAFPAQEDEHLLVVLR